MPGNSVVVRLPDSLRGEFKAALGPIFTDPDVLLDGVTGPLIVIGDVVTYHVLQAGVVPDVAVIDWRTQRSPIDEEAYAGLFEGEPDFVVTNPAGMLTEELLVTLRDAIRAAESIRIRVDGEEDLVTLPAILAAPDDACVVYGQPNEGMVRVQVTPAVREEVSELVRRMAGDPDRLFALLAGH